LSFVDETGIRTHIPVGSIACIMLELGTRVSHMAAALAARAGTLLVWVGEAGVRLYAAGQPGGARSDRLLYQAKLALGDDARLKVVRKMYEIRFGEKPPERRSVEQLRGIEGARVKKPTNCWPNRLALSGKGVIMTTPNGKRAIRLTAASVRQPHVFMASRKRRYWLRIMPLPSALSTPANPYSLFTTLLSV
jgi:hypothetical protein